MEQMSEGKNKSVLRIVLIKCVGSKTLDTVDYSDGRQTSIPSA